MSINSSTNTILGKRLHDSDNNNETKYAVQAPVNTKSELWEYFRQYVSTTAKKIMQFVIFAINWKWKE